MYVQERTQGKADCHAEPFTPQNKSKFKQHQLRRHDDIKRFA